MKKNTNYLVYQAYGLVDVLNEAMISIASLIKVTSEEERPEIYIYTDSPEYLKKYLPDSVNYIITTKEIWEKWKGEKSFVHRAKIKMLHDFSQKMTGNILYCDTDTYFLKSPSALYQFIERNGFVMHIDEGSLSGSVNKVFQKIEVFLKSYQLNGLKINTRTHMWNAGVLGFSSENSGILNEVLILADDLYKGFQKHVMEQLAFSYYFGNNKRIACDDTIFHYWDFKEYRTTLKKFFQENSNGNFNNWSKNADAILPMELIKEKQLFLKKPYWKRKLSVLFGR